MEVLIPERLEALIYYVPTGTTEGEKHILREAFVQTDSYAKIITPPSGSPRLLVGKKGAGKSAIIDFSIALFKKAGIPALLMKPMDFDFSGMPTNGAVGELTKAAYQSMLRAVSAKIGEQLSGLVTGNAEVLYKEAVSTGLKDPDLISRSAKLLSALSKPWTKVDFSKLLPNATAESCAALERALQANVLLSERVIYLFIDDTDQVASPSDEGHFNRIWAFLLAARELTQRIPQVRCVITIRDEIWRALTTEKSAQRDQSDHFLPLVYELNPSLDHVQMIVERRLVLAAERCKIKSAKPPYQLFFQGEQPRMPTTQKRSSWPDLIRTRSRERPRDAIQLLNKLATVALNKKPPSLITDDILEGVMPVYSKERAALLAQEFERECPMLENIIRSFAKIRFDQGSFSASAEQIRSHLKMIPSMFSVRVFGEVIKPDDDESAMKLWSFLYSTGFIYPRITDARQPSGYRHVHPYEEPTFVSMSRWNDIQNSLWEVHTVYRDYLISEQRAEESKFGRPAKRRPKHRGR